MAKKFEILEHKADLKIRVFGGTKEELFLNALLGMEDSMKYELRKPEESVGKKIELKSPDLPALLVDFLSECLYQIQVNKEVYLSIVFKRFSDKEIEAEILGKRAERFGEDIKAVTYHGLEVKQTASGDWEAVVLFDI